jgi:hypothetical protein
MGLIQFSFFKEKNEVRKFGKWGNNGRLFKATIDEM